MGAVASAWHGFHGMGRGGPGLADAARGRPLTARRLRAVGSVPADGEPGQLQRYGRAWRQALFTARRLVLEFGAARVVVLGDLVHPDRFRRDSVIELAVWGLRADLFWRAVARAREEFVPARIHDGDRLEARVAALARAEGIEVARRGGE